MFSEEGMNCQRYKVSIADRIEVNRLINENKAPSARQEPEFDFFFTKTNIHFCSWQ